MNATARRWKAEGESYVSRDNCWTVALTLEDITHLLRQMMEDGRLASAPRLDGVACDSDRITLIPSKPAAKKPAAKKPAPARAG